MMRLRLPFVFAAALLATVWGVGDARVPASMRRLRGQPGRVVTDADAGAPDALRADGSASLDPEWRPDSRPTALPAMVLVLPAPCLSRRKEHRAADRGATPRLTLPHASRAPPQLG